MHARVLAIPLALFCSSAGVRAQGSSTGPFETPVALRGDLTGVADDGARVIARFDDDDGVFLVESDALAAFQERRPVKPAVRLVGRGPWRTGRVLVDVIASDRERETIARDIAQKAGIVAVRGLRVAGWTLMDGGAALDHDTLRRLRADPRVRRVEAELLRQAILHGPIDDPLFPRQWHLENTGQTAGNSTALAGADVRARQAWGHGTGALDVVVAVLDTGVDQEHPDFAGVGKIVSPFDATGVTTDAGPDRSNPNGAHGTACAGLAVAGATGTGSVGVCPDCALMPVRIFDAFGYSVDGAFVDAFVHARDAGASVVSASWGLVFEAPPSSLRDAIASFARDGRGGRGGIVAFSSGNGGLEARPYEIASDPRVLSVAGTGPDDVPVAYATWGAGVDIAAPTGHGAVMTVSGTISAGPLLVTSDVTGPDGMCPALDDVLAPDVDLADAWTATMSGTSGACPQVAGAAALLVALDTTLLGSQVMSVLASTAARVAADDYDARGHGTRTGRGRLDVGRAARGVAFGAVCTPSVESCGNGLDDDCDLAVDGDDPDCGWTAPEVTVPWWAPCGLDDASNTCGDGICLALADRQGVCSTSCFSGECARGTCVALAVGFPACLESCDDDGGCGTDSACVETAAGERVCAERCGAAGALTGCPAGLTCSEPGRACRASAVDGDVDLDVDVDEDGFASGGLEERREEAAAGVDPAQAGFRGSTSATPPPASGCGSTRTSPAHGAAVPVPAILTAVGFLLAGRQRRCRGVKRR